MKEMFDLAVKREAVLECEIQKVNGLKAHPKKKRAYGGGTSSINVSNTARVWKSVDGGTKDSKKCFACEGVAHEFRVCKYR